MTLAFGYRHLAKLLATERRGHGNVIGKRVISTAIAGRKRSLPLLYYYNIEY
jgi:hypothetical protein